MLSCIAKGRCRIWAHYLGEPGALDMPSAALRKEQRRNGEERTRTQIQPRSQVTQTLPGGRTVLSCTGTARCPAWGFCLPSLLTTTVTAEELASTTLARSSAIRGAFRSVNMLFCIAT